MSETWFRNDTNIFMIPGYKVIHVNRTSTQGGGVAVFVKSTYTVKVLSMSDGDASRPDYILLDVLVGTKKILLATMYRKPKGSAVSIFIDDFCKFAPDYKYSFLCGDLNAGFGRGGDDSLVIPELLNLCNLDYVPFNNTYHTKTCDSNLDVIASNCHELLLTFGQTPASSFSHHDLIYAVFDLSVPHQEKQKITYRNLSKINVENLLIDVEKADWSEVYSDPDIDGKIEKFNVIISTLMNSHAPEKSKVMKQNLVP